MVRGSLRKEGVASWRGFHGHGRPWLLGGAAFRGGGEEESVREWRVKKMSKGGGGGWPRGYL